MILLLIIVVSVLTVKVVLFANITVPLPEIPPSNVTFPIKFNVPVL